MQNISTLHAASHQRYMIPVITPSITLHPYPDTTMYLNGTPIPASTVTPYMAHTHVNVNLTGSPHLSHTHTYVTHPMYEHVVPPEGHTIICSTLGSWARMGNPLAWAQSVPVIWFLCHSQIQSVLLNGPTNVNLCCVLLCTLSFLVGFGWKHSWSSWTFQGWKQRHFVSSKHQELLVQDTITSQNTWTSAAPLWECQCLRVKAISKLQLKDICNNDLYVPAHKAIILFYILWNWLVVGMGTGLG